METFQKTLCTIRQNMTEHISAFSNDITPWHVNDDAQWDVKLENGETPVPTECNDTTFCLRTKEGIFIKIRFGDDMDNAFEYLQWIPLLYKETYKDDNHKSVIEYGVGCNWGPVQVLEKARCDRGSRKKPDMDDSIIDNNTWVDHLRGMKQHFIREGWILQNDTYWDVKLEKEETPVATKSNDRELCLRTEEGFFIRVMLVDIDFKVVYWTLYIHDNEFNVLTTQYHSFHKRVVPGPGLLLEMARNIIIAVEDPGIRMFKKHRATDAIRKELMEKTCHPKRIEAWAEQGFDPFA